MRLRALGLIVLAAAAPARADGDLEDPIEARLAPAVPQRAATRQLGQPAGPFWQRDRGDTARVDRGAAGGALTGKTVYVSAGHGWVWDASLGRWRTQRGNTHDLVEDFVSAETVAQELVPYLHDLGAYVVPVREASMQPELAITDDADAGFAVTGAATPIAEGWSRPPDPIPDAANPFSAGGSVELGSGATATWVLDVPSDGDYEVYVAWVQGADRASDARYVIHHAGGDASFRLDQRRHGSTWVLLGQFHFVAGSSSTRGAIELINDGDGVVSADAARIGGGLGHVDRGGGASGRPAFEDAARYAAQWNGAPSTVWDYAAEDGNDDVGTRSRFSAWDHEAGEDAVYVAWHTNAPSPARGTSSFAYGPSPYGDLSEFSGVAGSLELMDAIHGELVDDLRAGWDPTWQDRAQHTAYFGEVNPSHNPEMPATLIEVAFHDTVEDADALRDPRFRRLAARAIAHGVARYFATRDGAALTLPPEPPSAARLTQDEGGLQVAWDAPDADPAGGDLATGYRVYLSRDGRAFDDGREVAGTSLALDAAEVAGAPIFARVTATNAGGESRPSPVVGAAPAVDGHARVLVVAGFTRLDGAMLIPEDLAAFSLATIDRAYLDRINDDSHAARHALAIAGAGYSVDVATVASVRRGEVALDGYAAVDWAAGAELTPLDDADRARLLAYLDGGGALILGGTDVARALVEVGDDVLLARLGASFAADDAATYAVTGAPSTGFAEFALTFDDRGPGGYDAEAADALAAAGAGVLALAYDGGAAAGVLVVGDAAGRSLLLGFPVETVAGAEDRTELMRRALAALEVEPDVVACACLGGCCHGARDDGGAAPLVLVLGVLVIWRRRARIA